MSNRRSRLAATCLLLGSPLILAGCADGLSGPILGSITETPPTLPQPGAEQSVASLTPAPQVTKAELLKVAQKMREVGNFESAARLYEQAHQADPNDLSALIGLGDSLSALGDSIDAAQAYGKAVALQPQGVEPLIGLGRSSISDNPQVAASKFEAVLKVDSKDVRAYNGLGVASDLMGDHATAQQHYRDGLKLDPENKALLTNLGLSLALSGDTDNAIFMLEELASAPGASPVARQNLSLAYALAGRKEEAAKVARVDLDEGAVRENLAFIEDHRGGSSQVIAQALKVDMSGVQFAAAPSAVPAPEVAAAPVAEAKPAAADQVAAVETAPTPAPVTPVTSQPVASAPVAAEPSVSMPAPAAPSSSFALASAGMAAAASAEESTIVRVGRAAPAESVPVASAPVAAKILSSTPAPVATETAATEAAAAETASTTSTADTAVAAPALSTPVTASAPVAPTPAAAPSGVSTSVAFSTGTPTAVVGDAGHLLIAMPVAALMAHAPAAGAGPATSTVSFYDSASPADYCRDAGLGAVNCMAKLAHTTGRDQSAMSFTAAFNFNAE